MGLVNSLTAILAVFHAVVDSRVRHGDAFIYKVLQARSGDPKALQAAMEAAPTPRVRSRYFDIRDYQSQFVAALAPATRSSVCGGAIPDYPLQDYLSRFFTHCPINEMSNAVYLIALVLLDRALAHTPALFLHSWNAHRLVLGAFVFAAKMHEDEYSFQEVFSKHGGVTLQELNSIEADFFKAIDYRGFVHHDNFGAIQEDLVREALGNEEKRGLVYDTLRSERIFGVDFALSQVLGGRHSPVPSKYQDPFAVMMRDMIEKEEYAKREECEGGIHTAMRAAGAASAFAQMMFPDLQVEPPSTEQELTHFLRRAADYTPEELQKFRLYRDIVRSPMRYFSYLRSPMQVATSIVGSSPPGFSPQPTMQSSGHRAVGTSPTGITEFHSPMEQWTFQSTFTESSIGAAPLSHVSHQAYDSEAFAVTLGGRGRPVSYRAYPHEGVISHGHERRSLDASFAPQTIGNAPAPRSDAALINAIGNAWGRRPGVPDVAQSSAKSAVAYILNDDDPFHDLHRMPASHARRTSLLARGAGRNGLVFGQ